MENSNSFFQKICVTLIFFTITLTSFSQQNIGGFNVYYGHMHNHTTVSDGTGSLDDAYNYAKNTAGLDFFGLSDHAINIDATEWAATKSAADSYNEDGVFVAFRGFEWSHSTLGHVTIVNSDDYCHRNNVTTFSGLLSWLSTRECVAFFNHPGRQNSTGQEFGNFSDSPSDKFVGIELWNKGDAFSRYYYNDGYYSNDGNFGFFDEALVRGWKIGAGGSEDNHTGDWGTRINSKMAVLATGLTRTEIYEALKNKRFFTTLDKNIAMSFKINGSEMGSSIQGNSGQSLQISASDNDGEVFNKVELIKNGIVNQTWTPNSSTVDISGTLSTSDGEYYYVKVTQVDGDEAISSPVFIEGGIVNTPPVCTLTNPNDGAHFESPATIVLSASASDPEGTVSNVEFFVDGILVGTDDSSPFEINWTIPENNAYIITAKATDNLGVSTASSPVNITVGTFTKTVSSQISNGGDDVEESDAGVVYITSTDLELVYDDYQTAGNQTVGLRFTGLNIPQRSQITNAYVQFTADETVNRTGEMTIEGHRIDDSPEFSTSSYDVSSRVKTSASVNWAPPAWTTADVAGIEQQTPDLLSIIQEIVNLSGFSQTSALSLIITGTGTRTAEAYDGAPGSAAKLYITYSNASAPTAAFSYVRSGLDVEFTDNSTNNGSIVNWLWDFGDGTTSDQQNPLHTYSADGNYTVELTVTYNDGTTSNTSELISVCLDSDNDGVCDIEDDCPDDPNKTAPGDCGCGVVETDVDYDGVSDCIDNCISETITFPNSPLTHTGSGANSTFISLPENSNDVSFTISDINEKAKPSSKNYSELVSVSYINGAGTEMEHGSINANDGSTFNIYIEGEVRSVTVSLEDGGDGNSGSSTMSISISQVDYCIGEVGPCTDSDMDGVCDADDGCPDDPDKTAPGDCGCGVVDFDSDNDGVADCIDLCPNDPNKTDPGDCGCGELDVDSNGNGISDCIESQDPPVADFSANPVEVFVGDPVDFTDLSLNNPTSRNWDFGDGQSSNQLNPSHIYNNPGTYTVSLQAYNEFGSDITTNTITVLTVPVSTYCEPVNIDNSSDYIVSTNIDGITNSLNSAGYTLFTTPEFNFEAGGNYSFTLQPLNAKNRNFWRIWIDANGDGDFEDINETLYVGNNKKGTVSGSITIPSDISAASTRLRISMKTGKSPAPCDDYFGGEVEDYHVNITFSKSAGISEPTSFNSEIEEEKTFLVYPNPASDKLFVKAVGWNGEKEIRLLDITGRSVLILKSINVNSEIDVSRLPDGIYFISVKNATDKVVRKIKIQ